MILSAGSKSWDKWGGGGGGGGKTDPLILKGGDRASVWSKNKRWPRGARATPPDPPLILEEQIKTLKQKLIFIFYLHWEKTIFSRE